MASTAWLQYTHHGLWEGQLIHCGLTWLLLFGINTFEVTPARLGEDQDTDFSMTVIEKSVTRGQLEDE